MGIYASCCERERMSGPAPHLDEYFAFIKESFLTETTGMGTLIGQASLIREYDDKTNELIIKFKQIAGDWCEARAPLRDIIHEAFDFHDYDKDGVLDDLEGQLLIQYFVERYVPFVCDSINEALEKTLTAQLEQCDSQSLKRYMREQMEERKRPLIASWKAKWDAYKKDRAVKNKAAFAVLDANGDGKLQKEEVVEGLFPDTSKYAEFMHAVGLMTLDEVAQHEASCEFNRKLVNGELTVEEFKSTLFGGRSR